MTEETIALLALCYEEFFAHGFRRSMADELEQELHVSLVRLFGSRVFGDFDWAVVNAYWHDQVRTSEPAELPGLLMESDSPRVEAVVHALSGRESAPFPLPAEAGLRYLERWEAVEDAIERWRAFGITVSSAEVAALFAKAKSRAREVRSSARV